MKSTTQGLAVTLRFTFLQVYDFDLIIANSVVDRGVGKMMQNPQANQKGKNLITIKR